MHKAINFKKDPLYGDDWSSQNIAEYIQGSTTPPETQMIAGIVNNVLLEDCKKQLPLFLRDWVQCLNNFTKEDMERFYRVCLKGGQTHPSYINEKWLSFTRNRLSWVLELDKEAMTLLTTFFNDDNQSEAKGGKNGK